ncbi:MAG: histidine phosphatase family protein [Labilithrix sp.]|nr:histidine phosphatase family protein [Labilithrix sp.]MCW5811784.1 histidine phosphatase family protein [Labilithrix sp.]
MDVYLLRTSLVDEGAAFLSAEGRRMIRALGHKLKMTEEPSFDRFVVSPEPAAVQTAELFADRTDYVGVVETLPLLVGSTPAEVIVPLLSARGSSIVVVADEPILGTIGAFLVGRPTFPPAVPGQVSFVRDRTPEWLLRPGEIGRQVLLVA